jgi:hypothetical protein
MLIQIRQSDVRASGTFSRKPALANADSISIGRGSDQLIQINSRQVGLAHCSIVRHSDGQFEATSSGAMTVNKRSCGNQLLKNGDIIRVASAEIEVSIPQQQATAEYAISLHVRHVEQGTSQTRAKLEATRIDQTLFRSRPLAWLLLVAIICGALAIPYIKSFGIPTSWISATPEATQSTLSSWSDSIQSSEWGPSHAIWNSGPLADAHQYFADQCDSCHAAPFEKTSLAACMECHSSTGVHSNKPELGFQVADEKACSSCHVDHNGGGLIRATQQRCVDCHSDIKATSLGMSELANVVDFDKSHPEFSLAIYRHNGTDWLSEQRTLGGASSSEESGLRFSHKFHLEKAALLSSSNSDDLVCSDCHSANSDGGFNDISMEGQCQSCHSLSFDTDVPEYQAPHQQIDQVVAAIETWYQRKHRKGQALSNGWKTLRPGQTATPTSAIDTQEHAQKVAESLIEREACVQCHLIEERSAALAKRKIAPVFLQPNWLKSGSFDHRLHSNAECSDCHAAADSSQSADVLIPSVKLCQTCHIGEDMEIDLGDKQTKSSCLDCHAYHQAPRVQTSLQEAEQ